MVNIPEEYFWKIYPSIWWSHHHRVLKLFFCQIEKLNQIFFRLIQNSKHQPKNKLEIKFQN
ncbi:hypothetical protein DERP_008683 [Dermatophagoides pteronyssinus]|uniref:Uncharacterized protein n=1 Tax=Dermatophagoides pteronyssinus TaxID=6956 RepID=A0ABQ8IVY6_DERPT|nr:hypothetical protein DERP_008683 [Dermatophagoides pteronyssinus]